VIDAINAEVWLAATRLPLSTALASLLALRPRRRGTPARNLAVIHTQILLAVVGTLVMLVVGESMARAFGIVGAAGLVRYRAKIDDPKDAGVMLSTLAIGLATGVGQWALAIFGTLFLLALLWIVESFEPTPKRTLTIRIKAKDTAVVKSKVETLFRRQHAAFEVRALSPEEVQYEVLWPGDRPSDHLSEQIAGLDPAGQLEVEIESSKKKEK
jgi:hypothetical protein